MTVQEKLQKIKELRALYEQKVKYLNQLKKELESLKAKLIPWYTGKIDELVASWSEVKGVLIQEKQRQEELKRQIEEAKKEKPEKVMEVAKEVAKQAVPLLPSRIAKFAAFLFLADAITGGVEEVKETGGIFEKEES